MDLEIHLISSADSPEFALFTHSLTQSSLIGLDAEWKPVRATQHSFPTVSLLQLACQLGPDPAKTLVFLLDLSAIPLPSIYQLLREVFVSPDILKLGFRFKQDLIYLSSTFCSQGCDPGFDRVEPFLDITTIYNCLQHKSLGRGIPKEIKSLASICKELLGISLSKVLQCSDWSLRPLTEEQKAYAAADAHCLIEIFNIFHAKVVEKGNSFNSTTEQHVLYVGRGLKEILENHDDCHKLQRSKFFDAVDIVRATTSEFPQRKGNLKEEEVVSCSPCKITIPMDISLFNIVKKYGERILLNETDRKPKTSKKKSKKQSSTICKEKQIAIFDEWHGPPPWDISLGGDGCPKFLCDVMVEGLAKHLRCVGIDAAIPYSKKPESRELIDQVQKEKRVLLTRDSKLVRHDYLIKNQIYRVRSLLKNEQLLEVIKTFQLEICEDQLMSRCTKCNGRFIQKPLTAEEASEAAKGFQVIPDCLFDSNLEFWQCMDCNQLYWEGTQYHNAVQKFINICKLNESLEVQ